MIYLIRLYLSLDYAAVLALLWQYRALHLQFQLTPLLRLYTGGLLATALWYACVDTWLPTPIVDGTLAVQVRFLMARGLLFTITALGVWRTLKDQGY